MTDLATKPSSLEPSDGDAVDSIDAPTEAIPPVTDGPDHPGYEWAPTEPAPKKRRTGMWIGIGAGAVAIALVATSLILIAPGTTVGGVPVGGLTEGAAAEAIQQRLDETTVVLTGGGGDVEITGAELGASVDAGGLAAQAYAEHPMWNVGAWNASVADASVELDSADATAVLRDAVPGLYVAPTDATLAFDAASASYVVTPAVEGTGVDVDAVRAALQDAFQSGETRIELEPPLTPVEAAIETTVADETAAKLNGMLDQAGFYVGDERTVPLSRDVVASWLTVAPEDGEFTITANAAAIQPVVDGLAPAVNRPAQNGSVVTDTSGNVLEEEAAGISGRELGDTSSVASDFAGQLEAGHAVFTLPVTEVAPVITTHARSIEVNLSEQHMYLIENGAVVNSWAISSGLDGYNTGTGHFRISAKLDSQNMGNRDLTKAPYYFTENVPNVMYYNGDEALHGAYWHNNFGNQMSHGCVNQPLWAAELAYAWAPMGTEVWVHY